MWVFQFTISQGWHEPPKSVRDGCACEWGVMTLFFSNDAAKVTSVAGDVGGDAENRIMTANTRVRLNSAD